MRATQDRYHVTRPLTHEAATGALDTELDHFRRKKQTCKCICAPVIGGVCVAGEGEYLCLSIQMYVLMKTWGFRLSLALALMGILLGSCP